MSTSANTAPCARPASRWPRWAALLALLLPLACKPSDEPPRKPAGAEGAEEGPSAAVSPSSAPEGTRGTIRLTAPEPGTEDATPPTEADVAPSGEDEALPLGADDDGTVAGLPADLVSRVRAEPSEEDRGRADVLNRKGLGLHRKLEIPAAVEAYRDSLQAWPGHPWANYNLACARALQGAREDALRHLRIVAALRDPDTEDRLRAARTDADFQRLRDDPDFRALTGYVPVRVAASPSLEDVDAVERVTESLRDGHVPAHAADQPWDEDLQQTTLLVRGADERARAMADEVEAALSGEVIRRSKPTLDPPVVLVLGPGAPAAVGAAEPSDLVGQPLVARPEGAVERLRLKPTGFFTWERLEDDGRRTTRTGRYHLANGALSLSYRQVVERPRRGAPPDVRIEQGRRTSYKVRVDDGALVVDDLAFRPEGG